MEDEIRDILERLVEIKEKVHEDADEVHSCLATAISALEDLPSFDGPNRL